MGSQLHIVFVVFRDIVVLAFVILVGGVVVDIHDLRVDLLQGSLREDSE